MRCFWRTIFILSYWKPKKGYYEEALWIFLGRRFSRLICKPVLTKYICNGLAPWPKDISCWYLITIYTNTFYNFDKYILQFGEILFTIWTNIFCSWAQLGAVTRRHFPVISFYVAAQLSADWKEEDYFSAFLSSITNPIFLFFQLLAMDTLEVT